MRALRVLLAALVFLTAFPDWWAGVARSFCAPSRIGRFCSSLTRPSLASGSLCLHAMVARGVLKRPAARLLRKPAASALQKKPVARGASLGKPSQASMTAAKSAGKAPSSLHQYARLLFDNARVRVCDFRLPAGKSATFHACYPTVRWQVDAGRHKLSDSLVRDADPEVEDVADKQVFFLQPDTIWRLENAGADTYRQILFEIKQPPKYSENEVRERLRQALYSTDVGTKLLFENELCRVWDFYLEPGEGGGVESTHHHVMDYVFVYVAPGRLLGYHPDGAPGLFDSVNDDNDVTWFDIPVTAPQDPKFAHGGKNGYDDRPMREYLVELK